MSTQSLKELVDAIKTQGKTLANASGTTARDMVYLSTAVERIYGADALIEMTDQASKPVEAIECTLATEQARTLTDVQVSKAVIKLTNTSGTHTATEYVLTVPLKGVAFVVDNKLPVPVKLKTAAQTTNIPQIAANDVGWVYCEGTEVKFVVDTAAISSAVTTPTTTAGDMIYREGAPTQTTKNISVHVRNYGQESYYYLRPDTNVSGNFDPSYEKTPSFSMYPGVTYIFDVSDASNSGHIFSFSTTSDGTHNSGVALTSWDATSTVHVTRSGTEGTANATVTVAVPATPNVATVYYYSGGTDSATFDTVGLGGQISIVTSTGVVRLPVGEDHSILSVDKWTNKPVWRKQKEFYHNKVAAVHGDITGLWSEGKFRMANMISDASTFPYQANIGTFDAQAQSNQATYRGGGFLMYSNGYIEPSMWGAGSEGANGIGVATDHGKMFSVQGIQVQQPGGGGFGINAEAKDLQKSDAKQILKTYANTFVVYANGDVYATGHGDEGQNGDGANVDRLGLNKVGFPSDAGPVRYLVGGGAGSEAYGSILALMEDGDVYGWGYNGYGQLGIGNVNNQNIPQKITTFNKNVKSIVMSGGQYPHCAAITTDQKCFTWGYNGYGQLGSGNTTVSNSPVERTVSGQVIAKAVVSAKGSYGQTYLVMASGRVYSTGYNGYGQLGHGNATTPVTSFTQVVGGLGTDTNKYVIDCFVPQSHFGNAFYVTNDGRMWHSGRNYRGEGATGDAGVQHNTPVICSDQLTWCSDVVSSANTDSTSYPYVWNHFLVHKTAADRAMKKNGFIYCAGYGISTLGYINWPTNTGTPVPCMLPQGAQGNLIGISNWGYHASSTQEGVGGALDSDGNFYVWGREYSGSLGGFPANTSVPVKATP